MLNEQDDLENKYINTCSEVPLVQKYKIKLYVLFNKKLFFQKFLSFDKKEREREMKFSERERERSTI